MTAPACLIIGLDNHVGAYLARLLDARGVALAGVGELRLLDRLGITDSVSPVSAADAAAATRSARLVFAISDGTAARAETIAESLATAATAITPPRFIHVADVAALASIVVRDTLQRVAQTRAATGIETASALLEAHDSRLGPSDSLLARITNAAWQAAQSNEPKATPLVIEEPGPRDWGWTPEYVDAIARLAMRPTLIDLVVASGHLLSASDMATHAFAYFRRDAAEHVTIVGAGAAAAAVNPAPVKAATGWSASTYGRDLVRAICEGAADRG
jgi:phenylpyruvate tautomerase PptA (4-oxalocrotonate tautomerase family)